MNDWLDYKGSGSARAYSGDYNDATISHSLRDKIDYGVRVVADTLTGAERKRYTKQNEASERLRQSYIERDSKILNEGAAKLLKDATDLLKEASEYNDKLNNAIPKLNKQMHNAKDPRALAAITSAENSLDNELRRTYGKIYNKNATLRKDYKRLKEVYDQYMLYNYPANYIKGVSDKLLTADNFLKKSEVPGRITWL